jgi:hypothetical protein
MGSFINFELLSPLNAVVVVMVLIFGAYAAYVVHQNAASLTPKL